MNDYRIFFFVLAFILSLYIAIFSDHITSQIKSNTHSYINLSFKPCVDPQPSFMMLSNHAQNLCIGEADVK